MKDAEWHFGKDCAVSRDGGPRMRECGKRFDRSCGTSGALPGTPISRLAQLAVHAAGGSRSRGALAPSFWPAPRCGPRRPRLASGRLAFRGGALRSARPTRGGSDTAGSETGVKWRAAQCAFRHATTGSRILCSIHEDVVSACVGANFCLLETRVIVVFHNYSHVFDIFGKRLREGPHKGWNRQDAKAPGKADGSWSSLASWRPGGSTLLIPALSGLGISVQRPEQPTK